VNRAFGDALQQVPGEMDTAALPAAGLQHPPNRVGEALEEDWHQAKRQGFYDRSTRHASLAEVGEAFPHVWGVMPLEAVLEASAVAGRGVGR
jgi:uncharacterized protein (DUF952 family)